MIDRIIPLKVRVNVDGLVKVGDLVYNINPSSIWIFFEMISDFWWKRGNLSIITRPPGMNWDHNNGGTSWGPTDWFYAHWSLKGCWEVHSKKITNQFLSEKTQSILNHVLQNLPMIVYDSGHQHNPFLKLPLKTFPF